MSLLLVEDNDRLADALVPGFAEDGLPTVRAATYASAVAELERRSFDALILDLGLPDGDGMDLLADVRARGLSLPILVVTARDAVSERIRALDLGADDFVIKPFVYAELLARIRALLRRASAPRWSPLAFADLSLDPALGLVLRTDGTRIALSQRESAVLAVLLRRGGDVAPRADILKEAFGYHFDPGTNVVDVHVTHLRQKLTRTRVGIEAVRGVGYRLVERP